VTGSGAEATLHPEVPMTIPGPAALHHTCLVYPSLESVRAAQAELRRQGREVIQEARAGDVFDFAYFQFPEIGSAIELLFLDGSKLPPPEAVIHPRG
jgi:hypothetical protein